MNFALGPAALLAAIERKDAPGPLADLALHLNEVTLAIQDAGERAGAQQMRTRFDHPARTAATADRSAAAPIHERAGGGPSSAWSAPGSMAVRMTRALSRLEGALGRRRRERVTRARAALRRRLHRRARACGRSLAAGRPDRRRRVCLQRHRGPREPRPCVPWAPASRCCAKSRSRPTPARPAQVEAAAASSGRLVMEAMWTLFLPAYVRLAERVDAQRNDGPQHLYADFGYPALRCRGEAPARARAGRRCAPRSRRVPAGARAQAVRSGASPRRNGRASRPTTSTGMRPFFSSMARACNHRSPSPCACCCRTA